MNRRGFARICMGVLILSTASLGWSLTAQFVQVSWQDNNGGYITQYSDWGSVKLQFDLGDLAHMEYSNGQYTGYVNIVISPENASGGGWVVRDLPVTFKDDADLLGSLPESVDFPLPVALGVKVDAVLGQITLTPEPLDDGPADNLQPLGIDQEDWLFGGFTPEGSSALFGNSGNMKRPPTTPRIIPRPVPFNINLRMAFPTYKLGDKTEIKITEKEVIGVDEEVCGCSPGSMARSFKYLALSKQITLDDDIQDIYKALKKFCDTKTGDKGGTKWENIPKGAKDYAADKKLPVDITSTGDPAVAAKALGDGSDVTLHFALNNGGITVMAHSVFVSSIQPVIATINGNDQTIAYRIKYLDDRKQGDKKAANDTSIFFVDLNGNVFLLDAKTGMPLVRGTFAKGGFVIKTKK